MTTRYPFIHFYSGACISCGLDLNILNGTSHRDPPRLLDLQRRNRGAIPLTAGAFYCLVWAGVCSAAVASPLTLYIRVQLLAIFVTVPPLYQLYTLCKKKLPCWFLNLAWVRLLTCRRGKPPLGVRPSDEPALPMQTDPRRPMLVSEKSDALPGRSEMQMPQLSFDA